MDKKITKVMIAILMCSLSLTSCIKDEAPNKECDILNVWVEDKAVEDFFFNTNQMRKNDLGSNDKEITFFVRSLTNFPKQLAVKFDITPGATIEPANGSVQDFTAGPVTYTVTSEDGAWKRQYKVQFQEASMPVLEYNFEHFDEKQYGSPDVLFHEIYELNADGTRNNIWASGNDGYKLALFLRIYHNEKIVPSDFPTSIDANGYKGNCLRLATQSTGDMGKSQNKPIAAGNLYLGHFNINYITSNPLKTTEMGIPFTEEPVRLRGYYKYKQGKDFTGADGNVIAGRQDEADVYGVLYRNVDENNNPVMLDGSNVLTSPYVVRKARVESLPPTDTWTPFEMLFDGDADAEFLH